MAKFGKFDGNEGTALECLGVSYLGSGIYRSYRKYYYNIALEKNIFSINY